MARLNPPFVPMGTGDLRALADRIERERSGRCTNRPLGPDLFYVGVCGEYEFSKTFRVGMDHTNHDHGGGDGGVDFRLILQHPRTGVRKVATVDVKTYRDHRHLLVEAAKCTADIYVLAHFNCERARLVGWQWREVIMRRYTPAAYPLHIVNYAVPYRELAPMQTLQEFVAR